MHDTSIEILDSHRTMAISTLRPDGWPQTTIVGYANDGLTLYFLVFRSSQKLRNIRHDRRVSFAVGGEAKDLSQVTAVYAAAHASEVTNEHERGRAWDLLVSRHPNLKDFEPPQRMQAAMMKAKCEHVSVVDYRKGIGHTEERAVGNEAAPDFTDARLEDWGAVAVQPGLLRPKKISR